MTHCHIVAINVLLFAVSDNVSVKNKEKHNNYHKEIRIALQVSKIFLRKIEFLFTNRMFLMLQGTLKRVVIKVRRQLLQPLRFHRSQFSHVGSLSLVHLAEQHPTGNINIQVNSFTFNSVNN